MYMVVVYSHIAKLVSHVYKFNTLCGTSCTFILLYLLEDSDSLAGRSEYFVIAQKVWFEFWGFFIVLF